MKKLLSMLLALSISISLSAHAVSAVAENAVSSRSDDIINFPDPIVKEYMCSKFDSNHDGQIQKSEVTFNPAHCQNITIDLSGTDAKCADGLEEVTGFHIIYKFDRSKMEDISLIFTNPSSIFVSLNATEVTDYELAETTKHPSNSKSIYLDLSNTDIHDLSPLNSLHVVDLIINGNDIRNGYEVGDKLNSLKASTAYGKGLGDLLQSITSIDYLDVDGEQAKNIKNISITGNLTVHNNMSNEESNQ